MLTRAAFWDLIGTLGGDIDQELAQMLTDRLAALVPADIVSFADHLARVLHDLDSPERAAQLAVDPTVDDEPMSMSDDLFLYARCAVVAAGRRTFDVVLADPAQMAGTWPVFDGEHLLGVAPAAYETATGDEMDHETPVSYETGSNLDAWGAQATPAAHPAAPMRQPDPGGSDDNPQLIFGWLSLGGATEVRLPSRPVYNDIQHQYTELIGRDPLWTTWWSAAGRRNLVTCLWLDPDPEESHTLKKGRKTVQIDAHLDGRFLTFPDRRVHLAKSGSDLQRVLQLVALELGLGPLPPMPPTPALPEGISLDGRRTRRRSNPGATMVGRLRTPTKTPPDLTDFPTSRPPTHTGRYCSMGAISDVPDLLVIPTVTGHRSASGHERRKPRKISAAAKSASRKPRAPNVRTAPETTAMQPPTTDRAEPCWLRTNSATACCTIRARCRNQSSLQSERTAPVSGTHSGRGTTRTNCGPS